MLNIVVKTFYGLEEVLESELIELGFQPKERLNRAVKLRGRGVMSIFEFALSLCH